MIFGNARFTVITKNLIRAEYSENGKFTDEETLFAVNRKENGDGYKAEAEENVLKIKTSDISLTYIDDKLGFSPENLFADIHGAKWRFGDKNKENLGGTLPTLDDVEKEVETDEGLLSRDGWFVIDDTNASVITDGWIKRNPNGLNTDIYLFGYGKDFISAFKSLTYVSGKAALPRKYVFGSWYSRWWKYTDKELLDIVKEYDEHDFPLDIMVIDMDWHYHDWVLKNTPEDDLHRETYGYSHAGNLGWTGYSWNRNLIPDPEKLLKEFHDRGIHVTLNDHPADGIRVHEELYPDFMRAVGVAPETGINLEFDAGDKRYMTALFDSVHSHIEKQGVDFWWLDWQQDEIKPYVKGLYKMRHLPWLNYCYYKHSENGGKRGLSFSRWGGFGDHKHPVWFSGDTKCTWDVLAFEVKFNQTSSNAFCLYWGHDTGGFVGERNAEMYIRWTQFAAFSACLRVHSQRDKALDRRPWAWGEEAENAMRKMYHLRSELIPYIYSSAYKAYEESVPLIRALYIDFPEEEKAYKNMQEYMFGDAFLCAPITSPADESGYSSQKVFVCGAEYYNFFTNEKYEDGFEGDIKCDITIFPLLVKGGVPIPMQEYNSRMTNVDSSKLSVLIYPGKDGRFTLYEDDGVSDDYKRGAFLKTEIIYKNDGNVVNIELLPSGEGYKGMKDIRTYTFRLPCTEKKLISVNGSECDITFEDNTNIIKTTAPVMKKLSLSFSVE